MMHGESDHALVRKSRIGPGLIWKYDGELLSLDRSSKIWNNEIAFRDSVMAGV
jgi:hypothetical protein